MLVLTGFVFLPAHTFPNEAAGWPPWVQVGLVGAAVGFVAVAVWVDARHNK